MSFSEDSRTSSGKNLNTKKSRLEKLATPKIRLDNSKRSNAFQVRPGALTYEITKTVNKLAQPKQRYNSDNFKYASPSFLSVTPILKPENLIRESSAISEVSLKVDDQNENHKIETYAKIAARRKSNYLRRLYDFPKPIKKSLQSGFENLNTENKFAQLMKNYNSTIKR